MSIILPTVHSTVSIDYFFRFVDVLIASPTDFIVEVQINDLCFSADRTHFVPIKIIGLKLYLVTHINPDRIYSIVHSQSVITEN